VRPPVDWRVRDRQKRIVSLLPASGDLVDGTGKDDNLFRYPSVRIFLDNLLSQKWSKWYAGCFGVEIVRHAGDSAELHASFAAVALNVKRVRCGANDNNHNHFPCCILSCFEALLYRQPLRPFPVMYLGNQTAYPIIGQSEIDSGRIVIDFLHRRHEFGL